MAKRQLLVGLHNQYLNQLARGFLEVQLAIGRGGRCTFLVLLVSIMVVRCSLSA